MRTLLALALLCGATLAQAAVQTREIRYQDADGTALIGYYAYDDAIKGKRPGVVVVHEWWGLNDYAKRRARDLAALGYNALAIDMYGDGKNTEHPQDAQAFMAAAMKDPAAAARRFDAGLELLKIQPNTNKHQLAAIGYCFGGKVVLDAARRGEKLDGVVSFPGAKHGFTNPDADRLSHGEHGGPDIGYDKAADESSWKDMQAFLKTAFD